MASRIIAPLSSVEYTNCLISYRRYHPPTCTTALSGGVHSPRTVILNFRHGSILGHCDCQLGLLSRIDVRPTVLLRPYHCMPPLASTTRPRHAHNSPRQLAADEVVMETYYYGHLSVLIKRRSRYSCSTRIFALTYDLVLQSQAHCRAYSYDPYT